MLNILMTDVMLDIKAVESKTHKFIKKHLAILRKEHLMLEKDKHLWLPMLCILSAKVNKGVNIRTIQLAELFHLLSYASQLHWSLPENNRNSKKGQTEIKAAVLSGDLLYSRIYTNICRYGLEQYLLAFTDLISDLNESLVIRDMKNDVNELGIYARLSESACYLGSSTASKNDQVLSLMREFGHNLGILKSAYDKDINIENYYESWQICWDVVGQLITPDRVYFETILIHMGDIWKIEKPSEIRRSII